MKNVLRNVYSIISIIYLILTIISTVIFVINPTSLYRLIEVIYMMFVSYYLIRSSGLFNRISIKHLGVYSIIVAIIGLFISIFLDNIIYGVLQYSDIYQKFVKLYLTISYFEITIYVLFLIIGVLSLIIKDKKPKFKPKKKKYV